MPEKVFKKSLFLGKFKDIKDAEDWAKQVDKDLNNIFTYIRETPKTYVQSAEPVIPTGDNAFWEDSDDDKIYLLKDVDGSRKKIELT